MTAETVVPQLASPWRGEYKTADLGRAAAYIDFGGDPDGVPVVLVHGLGGNALNFALIAPALRDAGYRVFALDLAGHGLTRAAGHDADVRNNAELVWRFVTKIAGGPSLLVGNSMGGLICSMVAAEHPDIVRGVVLLNPAMPVPRRNPGRQLAALVTLATPATRSVIARRRNRPLSAESEVETSMTICFADYSRRDDDLFDAHAAMVRERRRFPEVLAALGLAARTMIRDAISPKAVMQRFHAIKAPVLLIHGTRDRLVPVQAARWAADGNPTWQYEEWDDNGHVPMMELPARTAKTIEDWWNSVKPSSGD